MLRPTLLSTIWKAANIEQPIATFPPTQILPVGLFDFSGINIGRLANESNSDLLNLCAPPPIEELIATHAAMTQLSAHFGRPGERRVRLAAVGAGGDEGRARRVAAGTRIDRGMSGRIRSLLRRLNLLAALVSEYSSVGAMYELVAQISDGVPRWVLSCGERFDSLLAGLPAAEAASPGSGGPSMVRVIGPDDRLAMLPAPRELDATHPWCVPQTLLEELDRLAGQPDSAQWASQVRNQLHSLTDREQLEGDDVQIILADLSDAAQEAARMAEQIRQ